MKLNTRVITIGTDPKKNALVANVRPCFMLLGFMLLGFMALAR